MTGRKSSSPPGSSPPAAGGVESPDHVIEANEAEAEQSEDGYETTSNASTSLAPSVRDYNFENKRRYHKYKEGRYLLPNDDLEQEREDMKHALILHLCDGELHNAPLKNPQKILDIGTGTGIWAMDMGDEYPEAEVTGIDLSPIQPIFVPPNVHFVVDDAEADWTWDDNSLDYVHIRNMGPALKDWDRLLEQAYKALKPGGWVEVQDIVFKFACDDGSTTPEYTPKKTMDYLAEALERFGVDVNIAEKLGEKVDAAGFVNTIHDMKKVPVGTWPKDPHMRQIGNYARAVNYDSLGAVTNIPFTKGLGWTTLEVEVWLVQVRKDLMNNFFHTYHHYHSYSGQKPLETK
ncbi:Secondary metabolism regulator LAE1 [Colletotrichum sp. SAR11_240]|nr:Secondary metabolism regulator LAE1 [Colletotrichum sp. SAR11_240]